MDLYNILGIRRNASPAAIRKAHRKKARKHHPDCGGDPETFRLVQLAYSILSDPDRRARYDLTGDVDEVGPNNSLNGVLAILAECMLGIIGQVHVQGACPKYIDMVGLMKQGLTNSLVHFKKMKADLAKSLELLQMTSGRYAAEDGPNYLQSLLDGHIRQIKVKLADVEVQSARITEAIELLGRFSYKSDTWVGMIKAAQASARKSEATTRAARAILWAG